MQVNLSWTAVVPSAGVVRYDIYRALTTGTYSKIGETPDAVTTTYVDATVIDGNQYAYTVKAVNLAGSSAASTAALTPGLPPAPTGLVVTVTA